MMSGTGDTLRPSSPAGGAGQPRVHHAPSHESLTAHPLLSPNSSSLNIVTTSNGSSSANASPDSIRVTTGSSTGSTSAPKYLPYTPRQRVPTSSATTGTTVSSPVSVSPQHQHQSGAPSTATSKLQLQNLKAVAQEHGLDANSLGWAMLEELVTGSDYNPAWSEIWNMIAVGKAMMLLPLEQASSREILSPEFMKDHIIFCNGFARSNAPFVTLSGLRGTIDEKLTITSTLPITSKSFKGLTSPSTRASTLLTLPPLPIFSATSPAFPQVHVHDFIASLPVPPRNSIPPKPPLPPRPGARPSAPQSTSRLANPFASFFSKTATPVSAPATPSSVPEAPHIDHVIEVSAFTVDSALNRRNISKDLTKFVKNEIKEALTGCPSWVLDRTQTFSTTFVPFPKAPRRPKDGNGNQIIASDQSSLLSLVADEDPIEEVSQAFQLFYEKLEEDLKAEGSSSSFRRKDGRQSEDEKEKERHELDDKVRDTLEKVERALTTIFYDRLFLPSNADDASHDEALSSRIAALNMLDLSLDHLGVDAGVSGPDVDRVIKACGETISQLEIARCPADKAAILVASHRILVDGLSRLPPLKLKSDEAIEDEKTPQAQTFADAQPASSNGTSKERNSLNILSDMAGRSQPKPEDSEPLTMSDSTATVKAESLSDDRSSTSSAPSHTEALAEAATTPLLTVSPPKTPTPVSGDVLLPLIIFSVVKSNPAQLVSHLLYTQRFRNQSFGGEEGYCLINLMAVVEFLENVDLGALGLKDSEKKVLSAADLTPIPLSHPALDKEAGAITGPAGLRGRVEQQVDAIAGSANKVILGVSGVVDSGFGVLRALLPTTPGEHAASPDSETTSAPWNMRPGFGLLRRESGFSIASLAASLPGAAAARERARSFASSQRPTDDEGQEMVESRPGSVKNMILNDGEGASDDGSGAGDEEESEGEDDARHDTRSIRSFESMMSTRSKQRPDRKDRMSLTDRLAHMSRLTRGSSHTHEASASIHHGSPPPRISSLLAAREPSRFDTPLSSRASSPAPGSQSRVAPPNRRFLECSADDLKMSEIPELLAEYRRLAESMRSFGAFDEHV